MVDGRGRFKRTRSDMTVQRLHDRDPSGRKLWELRKRYQLVGRLECWVVGHLS